MFTDEKNNDYYNNTFYVNSNAKDNDAKLLEIV